MKPTGPTYAVILASMPSDVDPEKRMAQLLKSAGRRFKFRCKSVKKVEAEVKPVVRKTRTTQKTIGG